MSNRLIAAALVAIAITQLASWSSPTAVTAQEPAARTKWEYKFIVEHGVDADGPLNSAGAEGWELVAAMGGPTTNRHQYVLKRAK